MGIQGVKPRAEELQAWRQGEWKLLRRRLDVIARLRLAACRILTPSKLGSEALSKLLYSKYKMLIIESYQNAATSADGDGNMRKASVPSIRCSRMNGPRHLHLPPDDPRPLKGQISWCSGLQ